MRKCDLNYVEESTYYNHWYPGINPEKSDSDGDGYTDGVEIRNGTDPTIKYSHPGYVFMFYMDVDNNIGENLNLQKEIDEFRDINGIGGKAWVTALYDNYGNDNTYRYYIGMGYVNESIGEVDMSEPETLVNFVKWTVKNYSGTHYVLVIYDHGNAWRGLLEDDNPGSGTAEWMSLSDLKEAMMEIKSIIGRPIDITVFHACLMSNLAVAYELRGTTDIIVASAETMIPELNGHIVWPYKDVVSYLISHYNEDDFDDPHNLATLLVDGNVYPFYVKIGFRYEFQAIGDDYATMFAFDENAFINGLFPKFQNMVYILYGYLNNNTVMNIVKNAVKVQETSSPSNPITNVDYYGRTISGRVIWYFDLYSFAHYLLDQKDLPQDLWNAVSYVSQYLSYEYNPHTIWGIKINYYHGNAHKGTGGLSVYIYDYDYDNGVYWFDDNYLHTDLCHDTLWDEFLDELIPYLNGG